MPYLSDNSYLAIKPEATAGTAVIPTNFVPLVSEKILTLANITPDRRMKGIPWKSENVLRGNRSHEGEVVVLADPDTLGHFLNMVFLKGTTTGDADGYTHPFTVGDGKSYTFEIKKGIYAQRFFGVKVDELKIDFKDGSMQLTANVKAMGQFSIATLGVALTGAGMTELVLDDTYDIQPTRGLVIGDVLTVGGVDITITSIDADGVTVGFASTAVTASIGAVVYLKPQTASIASLQDPLYLGNGLLGLAADASLAATAAATRATATPVYDPVFVFKSNLFSQNGSNLIEPNQLLTRTREAQVTLKQVFENAAQRQKWLDRTKQAIVFILKGKFIKSDFTTQEKLTLTLNNVKLLESNNPLEVGELIVDEQNFEVLYDAGDGQAMSLSLVNRTASGSY